MHPRQMQLAAAAIKKQLTGSCNQQQPQEENNLQVAACSSSRNHSPGMSRRASTQVPCSTSLPKLLHNTLHPRQMQLVAAVTKRSL
jgi:hypothetical protein